MRREWAQVAPLVRARYEERKAAAGLTQQALAKRLGVTHTHVSYMLSGQKSPSLEVFVRLCEALDLSPDALLDQNATAGRVALAFEHKMTVEVARLSPDVFVLRLPPGTLE